MTGRRTRMEDSRVRMRSMERTIRELTREQEERLPLRRLILRGLVAGIFRGIGTVVGIALVGTVGVYLLTRLAETNMPGVAEFLAEIVKWIQRKL